MLIATIVLIAIGFLVVERLWPANELPRVRAWYPRVFLIKHPVEITLNSILSAAITYTLLGISIQAAIIYTGITAVAEFFYHWNVHTPRWLGPIFQRPESHRVHHKRGYHTNNYADLPIFDIMFGTYENPQGSVPTCGFTEDREDRFEDMMAFRNLHDRKVASSSPLHFLPTCIGCRKRWACAEARVHSDAG